MTYEQFIQDILDSRPNEKIKDVYMEHHHIKPRCLGGEDVEENMIWLFPEEHYKAHELLAKENPENYKLNSAWFLMCHFKGKGQERYEVSAEEYAEARKAYSEFCSEKFKGKGNPNYNNHKLAGANNPRARDVECIETGEILWGAMAFEQKYGYGHQFIGKCCKGIRKTAYGYHWKYVEGDDLIASSNCTNEPSV